METDVEGVPRRWKQLQTRRCSSAQFSYARINVLLSIQALQYHDAVINVIVLTQLLLGQKCFQGVTGMHFTVVGLLLLLC